jgi:hypothetical protein
MLKIIVIATIAAVPFLLNAGEANARRAGGVNSGTCPAGTCVRGGLSRANDVKNCRAENCLRGSHQSKPLRNQ